MSDEQQAVMTITGAVFGIVSHGMSNVKYLERLTRTGLLRRHDRREAHNIPDETTLLSRIGQRCN